MNVGNLISGPPAFSKSNLYIWKFSVHVLRKPSLKDFKHNLISMWNEHQLYNSLNNFLALPFFGIEMKTDFSSPVVTIEFSKFADILSATP